MHPPVNPYLPSLLTALSANCLGFTVKGIFALLKLLSTGPIFKHVKSIEGYSLARHSEKLSKYDFAELYTCLVANRIRPITAPEKKTNDFSFRFSIRSITIFVMKVGAAMFILNIV